MITLNNEKTGEVREYTCDFRALKELALANVECLMHIALADPDEHIEAMGGEDERIHDYSTDNGYCSWGERKEATT